MCIDLAGLEKFSYLDEYSRGQVSGQNEILKPNHRLHAAQS
jgi:hypothetical protein